MPIPYRHTQFGVLTIATFIGVLAIAGVIFFQSKEVIGIVMAGVFVLIALAFSSLTVSVDGGAVRFFFGIGIIRKTYLLSDIESARPVRNSWLYGWGIRYTPHGWLYNVSGLGAVELQLRSGKKVRIGSDEPERLADAINGALGVRR
jgi:hypothetical protein